MSIKLFNRLQASLPDLKVLEILFEHCFEGMMLCLAAPSISPSLAFLYIISSTLSQCHAAFGLFQGALEINRLSWKYRVWFGHRAP